MSRLDEIKARAEAATRGPWSFDWSEGEVPVFYGQTTKISGTFSVEANTIEDAEFIAAAREDVPWLLERIGEMSGAICWDTTCLNCASLLDSNYDQYMRAEKAEAEVERLTAERDALAAQVARAEALAEEWLAMDEANADYFSRERLDPTLEERNLQDWPDSTSHRETLVTGDLADRIRAKTGMTGEVVIHEDGEEGGYSEYTVEWDYEVVVKVGAEVVWRTHGYSEMSVGETRFGTFGDLMRWMQ